MLEEAASIVVILRLWRVFKIVEEFSAGASDREYNSDLSILDVRAMSPWRHFESKKVLLLLGIAILKEILTPKFAQKWR